MTAPEADADKNGRISVLEAFTHASRLVALHYEQDAAHVDRDAPSIDDTGDGKGRIATATGDDGVIAALTYLDVLAAPTVADPEVQQLLVRQQSLTEQIDDLRRRTSTMRAGGLRPRVREADRRPGAGVTRRQAEESSA